MYFFPDIYVSCDECKRKCYNRETLNFLCKYKNISDVLNMTIKEAYEFFINIPKIKKNLKQFWM